MEPTIVTCGPSRGRIALRWLAAGASVAAGAYAAYVVVTWRRYGCPRPPEPEEADPLLDRFLPVYDVVERHRVRIHAPAALTLACAREMELSQLALVRAIFKGRELIMGSNPAEQVQPRGLLAQVQSLGWSVLAELPDRELVVGAVTKPWEADVVFRSVPAEEFAAFDEPDYVKIAWTLRADPVGAGESVFRTETRALATDGRARSRFRAYWSFLSPGIWMIRRASLKPLKTKAERLARETPAST